MLCLSKASTRKVNNVFTFLRIFAIFKTLVNIKKLKALMFAQPQIHYQLITECP